MVNISEPKGTQLKEMWDKQNQTESKFHINESIPKEFNNKSKVGDYLDSIYSYPSKIKILWSKLDDFNTDLFLRRNYGVFQHSIPLFDFFEDWLFKSIPSEATSEAYSTTQYLDSFLDKVNSSNFFFKKIKKIKNWIFIFQFLFF